MIFACALVFFLGSCKKEKLEETLIPPKEMKENTLANGADAGATARIVKRKGNPLSAKNMRLSLAKLQANGMVDAKYAFKPANLWLYVKFSPNVIDSALLRKVINNDKIMVQNYPFANAELYYDDANITEEKRLALVDGKMYATLPADDMPHLQILSYEMLDSMYMPDHDEDPIMFDSMIEGGYITQEQVNQRICWRKPEGYVKFTDTQLGANQPVSETTAWVLFFGIPMWTYTDGNGYFKIGWRFLVGTFVGTKAENGNMKITPIDVSGFTGTSATQIITNIPSAVVQLIARFIVGTLHINGWYGACNINNININFNSHNQQRYWAHMLRAAYLQRQYCAAENINNGQTNIRVYAAWTNGVSGAASAPMLGHINALSLWIGVFNSIFGTNVNASIPSLFNVLSSVLPDMTFIESNSTDAYIDGGVNYFSSEFTHKVFHELSHVNLFALVGSVYWINVITDTLTHSGSGYGNGGTFLAGFTQMNESWAEFLSTNFAKRHYGVGIIPATGTEGKKPSSWAITSGFPKYISFNFALESERWFFNQWISSGFYNDCMDGFNSNEFWDTAQGLSIRELYLAHGLGQGEMCTYINRLLVLYPSRVSFFPLNENYKRNNEFTDDCNR